MPGLNGIATAARLKERGSRARLVFVTNMRDREFVQESLALGDFERASKQLTKGRRRRLGTPVSVGGRRPRRPHSTCLYDFSPIWSVIWS